MISWVIIVFFLIILVVLLKIKHLKHRVFLIMLFFLFLFLYTTIAIVSKQNSFDLKSTEGFIGSIKVYFGWLANGFQNLKSITGDAVKMDWTSTNGTFLNKSNSSVK